MDAGLSSDKVWQREHLLTLWQCFSCMYALEAVVEKMYGRCLSYSLLKKTIYWGSNNDRNDKLIAWVPSPQPRLHLYGYLPSIESVDNVKVTEIVYDQCQNVKIRVVRYTGAPLVPLWFRTTVNVKHEQDSCCRFRVREIVRWQLMRNHIEMIRTGTQHFNEDGNYEEDMNYSLHSAYTWVYHRVLPWDALLK